MPILTCQGVVDIFGRKQELKETVHIDRHVITSVDPPIHTIFLKKDALAARIISSSNCFVINMSDGPQRACSKLLDCFSLNDSLECEVIEAKEFGDSIAFTARVIHQG